MKINTFYAYLTRLRWIRRWGLMRNACPENVMEHSWEVATIAHMLALINNRYFDGNIDANAVAVAALYHDVSEVITGDMPTPVKYHSAGIQQAYKAVEQHANRELVALLPAKLQEDFQALLSGDRLPKEQCVLIKMADKIAAYLKCQAELKAGNQEFEHAAKQILASIQESDLPEVVYFMRTFVPACALSLDILMSSQKT